MKSLVSAAMTPSLPSWSPPASIVYIPEGSNQITATVDGKPKAITVNLPPSRGHEVAAKLQAALAKRQGENVRPHFGFDHKAGAASALPQSFHYEAGKGIMASVEWTGAGRAAIEGKDFSYFSPTFYLGDDGVPDGLPEKGELGSLVNSPAFRNIQRIAASDASRLVYASATEQIEARAQDLVAAGEAGSLNEGIGMIVAQDPELYRVSCSEKIRPEIAQEIADMMEAMEPNARAKLDQIATALHQKGKANSESDAFYLAIQQNPELYQEYRDDQDEVTAKSELKREPGTGFEAKAQALVSSGQARDFDEAMELVAASDPDAYGQYLSTLSRH